MINSFTSKRNFLTFWEMGIFAKCCHTYVYLIWSYSQKSVSRHTKNNQKQPCVKFKGLCWRVVLFQVLVRHEITRHPVWLTDMHVNTNLVCLSYTKKCKNCTMWFYWPDAENYLSEPSSGPVGLVVSPFFSLHAHNNCTDFVISTICFCVHVNY